MTALPPAKRDANTVFQDYALFPHMTVAQNVEYGLKVKGVPKTERRERAAAALDMVRLAGHATRKPAQLSGGQQQRVALARALVGRPKVLLLDEPLGALDLKLREQMQVELKAIQREVGITFVIVTHDQDEALTLCDRLAVFNNGRIEQIGAAREVYENPANRVRRRLRRHVQRVHRRRGRGADRPVGHVRDPAGADPAAAPGRGGAEPECAVRQPKSPRWCTPARSPASPPTPPGHG